MRNILYTLLIFVSCNSTNSNLSVDNNQEPTTEPTLKNSVELIKQYPHNPESFTEGLELKDGILYESTGDPNYTGKSKLAKINIATGVDVQKINLDKTFFGEGITVIDGNIFMMTYKEQKCFMYDAKTLIKKKEFTYKGEGWGMTNNGKQIINSNGSNNLYFRNKETFAEENIVAVFDENGPVSNINELEYVDGFVYANIWTTQNIYKIDPKSGKVVTKFNLDNLYNQYIANKSAVNEMNGIAYNPTSKTFFITGKNWPILFEVRLNQ